MHIVLCDSDVAKTFRPKVTVENTGMQIQNMLISFGLLIATHVLASGAPLIQPLKLKSPLTTKLQGNALSPYSANSKEELAKLLGPQQAEDIEKQMSFETHRVILFQWAGSGQDALVCTVNDSVVTFHYTRGRTRDFRQHLKAFAINREMTWTVRESDKIGLLIPQDGVVSGRSNFLCLTSNRFEFA